MRVTHPITKEVCYFIDKCLPFGSSRSCRIFQNFSDALRFLAEYKMTSLSIYQPTLTNYLDDFLFVAICWSRCKKMMVIFMQVCDHIGCPISEEKTEGPEPLMVFLGTLLNGVSKTLSIPHEKIMKVKFLLNMAIDSKKVTVKVIQKLTGTLNFLNRVIVPGRAFTRGMYMKLKLRKPNGDMLKAHHHVYLNADFIQDCLVWMYFLDNTEMGGNSRICRPFIDFSSGEINTDIPFFSDASKNVKFGIGAVSDNSWIVEKWPENFIAQKDPSIEFLELYRVAAALFTWRNKPVLQNNRVNIFCDNQAVQYMIHNLASSCEQCMKLIRLIALLSIENNVRIAVKFVRSKDNSLVDSLSMMDFKCFWQLASKETFRVPDLIPQFLTPVTKIWDNSFANILFSS